MFPQRGYGLGQEPADLVVTGTSSNQDNSQQIIQLANVRPGQAISAWHVLGNAGGNWQTPAEANTSPLTATVSGSTATLSFARGANTTFQIYLHYAGGPNEVVSATHAPYVAPVVVVPSPVPTPTPAPTTSFLTMTFPIAGYSIPLWLLGAAAVGAYFILGDDK